MDSESGNGPVYWFPLTEIVFMLVSMPVLAGQGPWRRIDTTEAKGLQIWLWRNKWLERSGHVFKIDKGEHF